MSLVIELYEHWWERKQHRLTKYYRGGGSLLEVVNGLSDNANIFGCHNHVISFEKVIVSCGNNNIVNEKWFAKLRREVKSWVLLLDCVMSRTLDFDNEDVIKELILGRIDLEKASVLVGDV